jgi:hypothetical protein
MTDDERRDDIARDPRNDPFSEAPPPPPPEIPPGQPPNVPAPPAPGPPPAAPPPAAYAPGQIAYGPPQPTSTNGMAIASLVLGILWLYWIGSILALIFGYIAKRQIDESQGRQTGRGMAIAGIVLGWIGVGVGILGAVIAIIAISAD